MHCLICKELDRTLASRRRKYIEARSAAYYRVSTELAAQKNVDMERAKSDLEEHQLVCNACETDTCTVMAFCSRDPNRGLSQPTVLHVLDRHPSCMGAASGSFSLL